MNDERPPALLPWTTPRLDPLGTMDDVRNDSGGDVDTDGAPANPISTS